MEGELTRRPKITLQAQSPRWGEGIAPSRRKRLIVPLPPKKEVEVSKKTKAAVAAAGTVGLVESNPHQIFYSEVNKLDKGWKTRRVKYGPKGHK